MVSWKSKKLGDLLTLANGIIILVLVNLLSSMFFFRADLTEEKRYSIKAPTIAILNDLTDDIYVDVYLTGEINASFRRFQQAIRETLQEFNVYSGNRVIVNFVDPATAMSQKAQNEFMRELASKGIQPTRVIDRREGQRVEKLIFPGAVVSYGGAEIGVNLLKGNKASSQEEEINQSIEGIEYEFANAIYRLTNDAAKRIGMVTGHGELDSVRAIAFQSALRELYDVQQVSLTAKDLGDYNALVIAKPIRPFSENEKYRLDQYIMQGGRVLFLLDKLEASMDSASQENYFAFPYNLNLDDQLFRYGVRINVDLVQDRVSGRYPVVVGQSGSKPQIQLMDWPFFPLINRYADHPITRNLDGVVLDFASSIDTVKAPGVKKTPLMFTSQYSRTVTAPVNVSIRTLHRELKPESFNQSFIPVAYLLEGTFASLYKNRFVPEGEDQKNVLEKSSAAKIIVVADGDIARNVVNPRTGEPQPLGFDPFTNYTFANKDLLQNMLAYLTDEHGLISARNKEIRIRPLDKERIVSEKTQWQVINLGVPLLIVVIFGVVRSMIRKKRYANFQ
jgi:gliding-associated putative ABC transporter substrate-binding component GldG